MSTLPHPAPLAVHAATGTSRWVLPALLLLLAQVALYGWMAPRGFDFTDESYYFHNYLDWRAFTGTVTFFGAYFEWPFRVMGGSIAGMRLLSLLLVLGSGALLMHGLLRYSLRGSSFDPKLARCWAYLVAPMASAMLYFGYLSTLRAPSYNLLTLCAMALATACLLRTLEQQERGHAARLAPFLYGVALGACALSKATTAIILTLTHMALFAVLNRSWAWRQLLASATLVTAGVALNFLLLTLAFPGWLASLQDGLEIMRERGLHRPQQWGQRACAVSGLTGDPSQRRFRYSRAGFSTR